MRLDMSGNVARITPADSLTLASSTRFWCATLLWYSASISSLHVTLLCKKLSAPEKRHWQVLCGKL